MAFNFNWHPLTADSEFYSRAKGLLTAALNKSPKPPIIVADILVTELNLGTTPPDLEILEIGDLADDRFRGIFKMQYSGDAFLTLQTKVQANPLNTYLSTTPTFTSPQPLAASSPLTIPLQITLSDFRLSGFVILVFSKAKGVTLVFRNDPLESLVVSSTFDSIPFIKDYLQKEIEKQLRNLFQEELPAIIHRLSLRWWGQDYDSASSNTLRTPSMPQKPTFNSGPSLSTKSSFENLGEQAEAGTQPFAFTNDPESDTMSSKSLLRLATLTDSQRTLSLFTPSITQAIYRAWATAGDRGDPFSTPTSGGTASTPITSSIEGKEGSRPTLTPMPSSMSIASSVGTLGSNGRPVTRSNALGKKKKTRVVNLRRKTTSDTSSVAGSSTAESLTSSMEVGYGDAERGISEANEAMTPLQSVTPPQLSPTDMVHKAERERWDESRGLDIPVRVSSASHQFLANRTSHPAGAEEASVAAAVPTLNAPVRPAAPTSYFSYPSEKAAISLQQIDEDRQSNVQSNPFFSPLSDTFADGMPRSTSSSSIAEKAMMMKMAGEMARRWGEERIRREKTEEIIQEQQRFSPPPAYQASQ